MLIVALVLLLVPITIGFVAGFMQGFKSGFETTDQKVARLMREAAGLQTVQKSFLGENPGETKMRDLFRNMIRINQEYQATVDKLDISETHKLASPETFADPSSAAEGLRQLHSAYDLDSQQEQKLHQLMEDFRRQLAGGSAYEGGMLKGFNEGLDQAMPKRQHTVSAEKTWVDAMDDVYNYAELHHADFSLRDGQLVIADGQELQEFNVKINNLNARRQEFVQAKNEFDRYQGETWQKLGVSRQQTVLH